MPELEVERARAEAQAERRRLLAAIEAAEARMAHLMRERTGGEVDELAQLQARADSVAAMHCERAPVPMAGETPLAYRKRVLGTFQRRSDRWRDVRLDAVQPEIFDTIEREIYADAEAAARNVPSAVRPLFPETKMVNGVTTTRFHGDILGFMEPYMSGATVCRILRPGELP